MDSIHRLMPFHRHIKQIEDRFGTAVSVYFIFVRWLMIVNLSMSLLSLFFVVLPRSAQDGQGFQQEGCDGLGLQAGGNSSQKVKERVGTEKWSTSSAMVVWALRKAKHSRGSGSLDCKENQSCGSVVKQEGETQGPGATRG